MLSTSPGTSYVATRMSLRRPSRHELLILAFVAASALAFLYPVNWQDVSRLGLTQSVALDGSLRIDRYASQTGDKALFGHHYYSDKAPGMSFAAVPAFEILDGAGAVREPEKTRGVWTRYGDLWLLRVATGGLLFLLAVFLIGRAAELVAPGAGGVAAATFGLGTLAMPLAAVMFGHVGAGTVAFASFLLAWRATESSNKGRALATAAGALAGAAVLLEYQVALAGALVFLYVIVKTRRQSFPIAFCLGAATPLVLLGLYNNHAFGSPLHLSYRYTEFESQQNHFFGVATPSWHGLWETLFAGKGLVSRSPVVLLAAAGLVLLWRAGKRTEAGLCAATVCAFVLYDAGYFDPYGGTSPGPRFLVPALPFLALGFGPAYRKWPRLFICAAVISLASMIQSSATWNESDAWTFVTVWSRWGGLPRGAGGAVVCVTALAALALAFASSRFTMNVWRTTRPESASSSSRSAITR
jgi:hypothetical protein